MYLAKAVVDAVGPAQYGHRTLDLYPKVADDPCKLSRMNVLLADVIHQDRSYACVDVIANIIECDRERVNILAIERRDERFVKFVRDLMGKLVASVLHILDPLLK